METTGTNEWRYGLYGCCDDIGLCIITCFVPCYTIGKNAEYLGDNCMTVGLLACCCPVTPVLTWRIRQHRGIAGNMVDDILLCTCYGCCQEIREARELKEAAYMPRDGQAMARS